MTLDRSTSAGFGWEENARCKGLPVDWFYPPQGNTPVNLTKIEIVCTLCSTCPVKKDCLQAALERKEEYGLWGGMTPTARKKLSRKMWVDTIDEDGNHQLEKQKCLKDPETISRQHSNNLNARRKQYNRNIITHQWIYKLEPEYKRAREIIDKHFSYETPTTPTTDSPIIENDSQVPLQNWVPLTLFEDTPQQQAL